MGGRLGKKQSSLSGGVATAYDNDLFVVTVGRLHAGGCIVDALIFKPLEVLERQLAVLCAGGDDDRSGAQGNVIFEGDLVDIAVGLEGKGVAGDGEAHAEFQGLHKSTVRESLPRDAGGKTEIVFDFGACARLSSRRNAFDDYGGETLRRGIDGSSETGRSTQNNFASSPRPRPSTIPTGNPIAAAATAAQPL